MRLEFPEVRKIPIDNGAALASFPINKIVITDEAQGALQIQLYLRDQAKYDEISGQLVSMKTVLEPVREEYIGFEVGEQPESSVVTLIKDDIREEGVDIEKSLKTLVEMGLIHKDTATEILTRQDVQQLMAENARSPLDQGSVLTEATYRL